MFARSVVGQFTPTVSGKAWQACAQQTEKPIPHKLSSFMSNLCACPTSSASIERILSRNDLAWSKIRKSLDAKKVENLVKIYQLCRAEEDNQ